MADHKDQLLSAEPLQETWADEMDEFRYPERISNGGRLFYSARVPVLVVRGTPEEIGRQMSELAVRPAYRLLDYPLDFLRAKLRVPLLPRILWKLLQRPARRLYQNIPDRYRAELEAAAGSDRNRLIAGNTLFDMAYSGLRPLFGCSSVVVPPYRSATGGLLFGRNLDFEPLSYLHEYSLVTAYGPTGDRLGFVSIGFPGMVGCFSGMNAAGLCLARHEVLTPKVHKRFDRNGVPFAAALRTVMETCRTVDEAIELLRATRHATVNIVVLADSRIARVAELTPEGVYVREPGPGVIGCANHFRHPSISNPAQPNSYSTLDRQATLDELAVSAQSPFGFADAWTALDRVNQGALTIQSMVFEPAARSVHVAFGAGPTTALNPVRLDLVELLA